MLTTSLLKDDQNTVKEDSHVDSFRELDVKLCGLIEVSKCEDEYNNTRTELHSFKLTWKSILCSTLGLATVVLVNQLYKQALLDFSLS